LRTRPGGAEHRTAAETQAEVLDALILDDAVPAYGIDVDVDGGEMTLCGAVDRVPAGCRRTDRPARPRCLRGAQPVEGVV